MVYITFYLLIVFILTYCYDFVYKLYATYLHVLLVKNVRMCILTQIFFSYRQSFKYSLHRSALKFTKRDMLLNNLHILQKGPMYPGEQPCKHEPLTLWHWVSCWQWLQLFSQWSPYFPLSHSAKKNINLLKNVSEHRAKLFTFWSELYFCHSNIFKMS